jgi:hypothetical protein
MYFNLDLSFYMFVIIYNFLNKMNGQSWKKVNSDKYFETEGVLQMFMA